MIEIKKGLDLPITGAPVQSIKDGNAVTSVAVVGHDYQGMKPTMAVKVGDRVKLGQVLFSDKKIEGVHFTAPAAGIVQEINRGARRVFQSLVITLDGDESEQFAQYDVAALSGLSAEQVEENLVNSGMWTALRTRPFSKTPKPGSRPSAIFISAMDTTPLCADPAVVIAEQSEAFENGLAVLDRLAEGKVFVGKAPGASIPTGKATVTEFGGVHPAGNVGTHIHFLHPVAVSRVVWTLGYQDVIAIGKLFTTGQLSVERVIALAGPQVNNPRLIRTRIGANVAELAAGETKDGENRLISGSVFGGRTANAGVYSYLGRFHNQISVLVEGRDRELLHYVRAGFNAYSKMNTFMSAFSRGKKFDFTTTANGSERCLLPLGNYEAVMPLDILATPLLRALIVKDLDSAEKLGALELDEEDLALCTYVCTGKYEFGPILRDCLTTIEREG